MGTFDYVIMITKQKKTSDQERPWWIPERFQCSIELCLQKANWLLPPPGFNLHIISLQASCSDWPLNLILLIYPENLKCNGSIVLYSTDNPIVDLHSTYFDRLLLLGFLLAGQD